MPELITETLLIVTPFKHRGTAYERGDRVPIRHRAIRRLAAERPEWFAMEYAPEPVDLEWLASLEAGFEAKYDAVRRAREEAKVRQERALRAELREQNTPQPELERRYAKQEAERLAAEAEAREEREREQLEEQVAIVGDDLRIGFNF
jgi:hypothetical protein